MHGDLLHLNLYSKTTACRACASSQLRLAIDLGEQYVSDFVKTRNDGFRVPLQLLRCVTCGLVQLSHTVNSEKLYSHFWYESSISSTMQSELGNIATASIREAEPVPGDVVLDIGCNDGTLLKFYDRTLTKVGFEPAINVAIKAQRTGHIFTDYFNAPKYLHTFKRATIITAIAMFYDLPDPNRFVHDITKCLASHGVFIIQMNYLGAMLENNCYDNILHEHLEYYSLKVLQGLLAKHGLMIYDVELPNVNGGSIRTYSCFKGERQVNSRVQEVLAHEESLGLRGDYPYQQFKGRIDEARSKLLQVIDAEKASGRTSIWVLGASTRGNTLLQYCNLGTRSIKGAVDRNPEKWGRMTVGSWIPIWPRSKAGSPDSFLVLPYHFLGEFRQQEKEFLDKGGKLIVPLPEVRLVP